MHPDGGSPRALLIGHATRDLTPQGPQLGGSVAYAGLTLAALDCQVRVLTAASRDLDLGLLEESIDIHCLPASHSTTFENVYQHGARQQFLREYAGPITAGDLPQAWDETDLLFLAPVADEVNLEIARRVDHKMLGITAQGWFREPCSDGPVKLIQWQNILPRLPREAIIVISVEDLGGSSVGATEIARQCSILALTDGARGAEVFWNGGREHVPAPLAEEIDPTGAGDIFAAIFFYRLLLGDEPPTAARRANQYAAASVNRSGLRAVPARIELYNMGAEQA